MLLEQTLFMIQFLGFVFLFLFVLWDLFSEGKLFDWKFSIISILCFVLCTSLGHQIQMLDPETLIYSAIMNIENPLSILFWIFWISGLIMKVKSSIEEKNKLGEAYSPVK